MRFCGCVGPAPFSLDVMSGMATDKSRGAALHFAYGAMIRRRSREQDLHSVSLPPALICCCRSCCELAACFCRRVSYLRVPQCARPRLLHEFPVFSPCGGPQGWLKRPRPMPCTQPLLPACHDKLCNLARAVPAPGRRVREGEEETRFCKGPGDAEALSRGVLGPIAPARSSSRVFVLDVWRKDGARGGLR